MTAHDNPIDWGHLTDRDWQPDDIPALIEHSARASRENPLYQPSYTPTLVSQQFTAVIHRFQGEACARVAEAIFARDGWWRTPQSIWVLSTLSSREHVGGAARAQLHAVGPGEEAQALARWMGQLGLLLHADVPYLRALRANTRDVDALQLSLSLLAKFGALSPDDLEAGRRAALDTFPDDRSGPLLANIIQIVGREGFFRGEDLGLLLSRFKGPRRGLIVAALREMGRHALPAVERLCRICCRPLNATPAYFLSNVMGAVVEIEGGPQALACLDRLAAFPDITNMYLPVINTWLRALNKPEQRASVLALVERFYAGSRGQTGHIHAVLAALGTHHPQATQWAIEGLLSAAASQAQPWLNLIQSEILTDGQRNAVARHLLAESSASRGWLRVGALVLLGARSLDADVRALLMGRWSQAHAASQDPSGRRLPRARHKKRITYEALTIAVAIHESLQDPSRAESAARALARWSRAGLQMGLRYGAFYNLLDDTLTSLCCVIPQNLPDPVFDALSRALCALIRALPNPPEDADNERFEAARQAAYEAALDTLLILYTKALNRVRDAHAAIDRLCRLTEAQDPSAPTKLAAALARHGLPPALAQALAQSARE